MNSWMAVLASYVTYGIWIQYTWLRSPLSILFERQVVFVCYLFHSPHHLFLYTLLRCTRNCLTITNVLVGAPYLRTHVCFTDCTLFSFACLTTLWVVYKLHALLLSTFLYSSGCGERTAHFSLSTLHHPCRCGVPIACLIAQYALSSLRGWCTDFSHCYLVSIYCVL